MVCEGQNVWKALKLIVSGWNGSVLKLCVTLCLRFTLVLFILTFIDLSVQIEKPERFWARKNNNLYIRNFNFLSLVCQSIKWVLKNLNLVQLRIGTLVSFVIITRRILLCDFLQAEADVNESKLSSLYFTNAESLIIQSLVTPWVVSDRYNILQPSFVNTHRFCKGSSYIDAARSDFLHRSVHKPKLDEISSRFVKCRQSSVVGLLCGQICLIRSKGGSILSKATD